MNLMKIMTYQAAEEARVPNVGQKLDEVLSRFLLPLLRNGECIVIRHGFHGIGITTYLQRLVEQFNWLSLKQGKELQLRLMDAGEARTARDALLIALSELKALPPETLIGIETPEQLMNKLRCEAIRQQVNGLMIDNLDVLSDEQFVRLAEHFAITGSLSCNSLGWATSTILVRRSPTVGRRGPNKYHTPHSLMPHSLVRAHLDRSRIFTELTIR